MDPTNISIARRRAGLTQAELARRARTSRPTLSAYEHGRVSPTVDTLERILAAADHELVACPKIQWRQVPAGGGRMAAVPNALPELEPAQAFRVVDLPLHLKWSGESRQVDLSDRSQRARAYEVVLREGRARDIASIVDGALLVDAWNDLIVPRAIRSAWQPLIDQARHCHA